MAGLLAAAALAGVVAGRQTPLPDWVDQSEVLAVETTSVSAVTVHVAGWVAQPGLVTLGAGARVADAVAAAGGLLPGADAAAINLAGPLSDGDQIVVPRAGERPEAGGGPMAGGKLRLNQADAAALEQLPGVGPVLAERIVAYREEHGPFRQIEDLLDVAGIGEAKLASLRDLVAVP